jgi:hypothetical protein
VLFVPHMRAGLDSREQRPRLGDLRHFRRGRKLAPMREPEPEKRPAGVSLPELTWDQFLDIEDGPLRRAERV